MLYSDAVAEVVGDHLFAEEEVGVHIEAVEDHRCKKKGRQKTRAEKFFLMFVPIE